MHSELKLAALMKTLVSKTNQFIMADVNNSIKTISTEIITDPANVGYLCITRHNGTTEKYVCEANTTVEQVDTVSDALLLKILVALSIDGCCITDIFDKVLVLFAIPKSRSMAVHHALLRLRGTL